MFDQVELNHDAALIAALMAIHPQGLGGVVLRGGASPMRDAWLARLRELLPQHAPIKRIPLHISDERLLGGLDLAATLNVGKPILQSGVLSEADGGVVVLAMAERVSTHTAAVLCSALDRGEVSVARDGVQQHLPARWVVVALDESEQVDEAAHERLPDALQDRLAFSINMDTANRYPLIALNIERKDIYTTNSISIDQINTACSALPLVRCSDEVLQALCAAALALGVSSLRASSHALNAALALAALRGANEVSESDAAYAAQLVLAHRATQVPTPPADEAPAEEPTNAEPQQDDTQDTTSSPQDKPLEDVVLEAVKAAIPTGLLAQLQAIAMNNARVQSTSSGRAGALRNSQRRGRPIGARRGLPSSGARLNVIETLRAAAPWQKLRQTSSSSQRIQIRKDDFHITRLKQRSDTTTVFIVDASGSAALHRLAEAKGAVELLLADCYVRRDRVAMIAFRGTTAELILSPTRSLVRAKRSLAALPGGGGTPLAAAIDSARDITQSLQRQGCTPVLVFLTDGKGNIARDGSPGRALAIEQSLSAAQGLAQFKARSLLIDTSREPQTQAQVLAQAMGAQYLPLPYADAAMMSRAVMASLS
jgi:magnesium chelatase subunit D